MRRRLMQDLLHHRALALLAIACGVGAVALATGDAALFWVAMVGMGLGNLYLWRTQYRPSRLRTAALVLLLVVLLAYLGRDMLLSSPGNPVLLARYLVYGLIVNSFDLLTRRNILGNVVVAGLLFVLLSPIAFTLGFAVLAMAYVILATGAALAGQPEEQASQVTVEGTLGSAALVRLWMALALGILLLTGAIFFLMPRGTVASAFQPTWLPSRLDLTLGSPGLLPSRPSAGVASEILVSQAPASANGGAYIPLGYVGSAADAPVLRVRSRVASYWRGATLDRYDGTGWLPSVLRLVQADGASGEFLFPDATRTARAASWYAQIYYLLVDQPNALFTGYSPGRLFIGPASEFALSRGTIYMALSPLPALTPAALRRDRADPADALALRQRAPTERVASLAESIVAGAATDYDKAVQLERFLLEGYSYDLTVEPPAPGQDATDVFLFERQAGYCAQFATAMAVMARHVGLPARVAVGYLPGVYDPLTGTYTVRAGDAHAWVEIHFRNSGWVPFDPTPRPELPLLTGAGGGPPGVGGLSFWSMGFATDLTKGVQQELLAPLSRVGWPWLALGGAAGVGALLLGLLLRRRRTQPKNEPNLPYTALQGPARQRVLDAFVAMAKGLSRRGLPARQAAHTPNEYAEAVMPRLPGGGEHVAWLAEAATAAAYDPRPLDPSLAPEAQRRLQALRRLLKRKG